MTPEQFIFWLKGYFDIEGEHLSLNQCVLINEKLTYMTNQITTGLIYKDD